MEKASETCFAFSQRQALLIDADIYLAFDLPRARDSSSNINKEINKILTKILRHGTSLASPAGTQTKHQIKNSKAPGILIGIHFHAHKTFQQALRMDMTKHSQAECER